MQYVQPGKPNHNAYFAAIIVWSDMIEYTSIFSSKIHQFKVLALDGYGHITYGRPNMGLGGITPRQEQGLAAKVFYRLVP